MCGKRSTSRKSSKKRLDHANSWGRPRRAGVDRVQRKGRALANILLQTTIPDTPDDWNVGRFALLADELRGSGHEVTARNRDAGGDDSVLSVLDSSDYDELWLMAVDTGDGLTPGDAAGIMRFRERGGGVLTA